MNTRVLIADDDPMVRDAVRGCLQRDGHDVTVARDGNEALRILGSQRVDLAVLDVAMPGPDGLTLCRGLRRSGESGVPVILLTARDDDERITGLEAGADDCLSKPFSPRELMLRVRAVLRAAGTRHDVTPLEVTVGALRMSTAARTVTVAGKPIGLTHREFELLLFFLTHADTVFSREELLAQVWHWDYGDLSTVTVHVKRLRAKLGAYHRIRTVWGLGYQWRGTDGLDNVRAG